MGTSNTVVVKLAPFAVDVVEGKNGVTLKFRGIGDASESELIEVRLQFPLFWTEHLEQKLAPFAEGYRATRGEHSADYASDSSTASAAVG